ncbi:DUF6789 family protein [Neolewinella persica]|uniref:DUF6789 family protein n=1 Tax=Neolewinella persica TaxID=70998 RepID=UPI00037043E7|nr:DUF6789 family protein [Neolewinella persica]
MKNDLFKGLLAGVIGTVAMTAMMMVAGKLGMPTMEPPKMLATTMGVAVPIGFVMHFMIGIVFALMYVYLFRGMLSKISSAQVKGVVFGIIAFVFAQVGMFMMGMMFSSMPEPQGNKILMMLAGLMGHILFGVVVATVTSRTSKA